MRPSDTHDTRAKISEFQKRHRIGLLTLVFTDTVASTRLKQELGDQKAFELTQEHHDLVRNILREIPESEEISTAGDSFFIVFARPSDAVRFGLKLQSALLLLSTKSNRSIQDRVGIHVGEVVIQENAEASKQRDLYGLQVDIASRITSLAEGAQILLTRSAFDHARQALDSHALGIKDPLTWLNHGPYLFKGIEEPYEVCEVGFSICKLTPPSDNDKARKHFLPGQEPVLGWRPANGQIVPNTEWELTRKLGEGGFGEVWVGCHRQLDQKRVFKFCFHAERVRSLRREVTLFRLLQKNAGRHPNIVGIQDVFFDQPPFYIMLDYADCKDLVNWCHEKGGPLGISLPVRLEIIAQIADALNAAANAGVIHRDVKPNNILVEETPTGVIARLTDFGIGQVVASEILDKFGDAGFTQTMTGADSGYWSGTQLYLPPELLSGAAPSPQSDIYSLGVILFQLLVGDFRRAIPLDWSRSVADPLLRDDLNRCLAGDPGRRFSQAVQLASSLRTLPQRARYGIRFWLELRDRPWILTAAATIVGMVLLTTIYGLWQETLFLQWKLTRQGFPFSLPQNSFWVFWEAQAWMLMLLFGSLVPMAMVESLRTRVTRRSGSRVRLVGTALRRRAILALITGLLGLASAGYVLKTAITSHIWQLPSPFGNFSLLVASLFAVGWGSSLALWQAIRACVDAREDILTARVLPAPESVAGISRRFEIGRPRVYKALVVVMIILPLVVGFAVAREREDIWLLAFSGLYAPMLVRFVLLARRSEGRFLVERIVLLAFSLVGAFAPAILLHYPAAWIPLIVGLFGALVTIPLAKVKLSI